MKNMAHLFLAALVLHAQAALGDDVKCKTDFGQAVRACARSLDLLALDARGGAQKACVDGAVLTKAYCMSGTNACLDRCQVAYESSVGACEATFAPAMCAENATCEAIIQQQRDNCISNAVNALDFCSAACP